MSLYAESASIVLISSDDTIQVITDSLPVESIPISRSLSDMMETVSYTIPGNHWVDPTEVWRLATEYQGRVVFYGIVVNASISWEEGVVTTEIEATDMMYRLSHLLVPIRDEDGTRIGMSTDPLMFIQMRPDQIVTALLGGISHWVEDTYIRPGNFISEVGSAEDRAFERGTTRLEAIQTLAEENEVLFCVLYSKTGGKYYADGYFDSIEGLSAGDL